MDMNEALMFQTVLNTTIRVAAISAIPELNEFVKRLIGVCYLDFEKIPSLQSFIVGSFSFPSVARFGSSMCERCTYYQSHTTNFTGVLPTLVPAYQHEASFNTEA